MRIAFKEWAVVVDALGRGEQIVILRKGGISEGRGGFKVEHPHFLFFPTLFHQQRQSVREPAQKRFDEISVNFPPVDRLGIEYCAEVIEWHQLTALSDAQRLQGQHIWRDEVIAERFEWGREKNIYVLAVRVFRLPKVCEIPSLSSYGGCKSWIDLNEDISTEGSLPVLDEQAFARKLADLRKALVAKQESSRSTDMNPR